MSNVKLQDEEWMKIQAFLHQCPQVKVGSARKCRRFVEAALWILRSGAQWRLLPSEYGNWNSVYKRFGRWCEQGVWTAMLSHFADDADVENVMVDSTVISANACAGGGLKKTVDKPHKPWGVRAVRLPPKST